MVKLDNVKKIRSGAKLMADAVGCTLGPKGYNVMIQTARDLTTTKDGVTVASEVHSSDYIEQMVIDALRNASFRTNKEAGDNTTTSILLSNVFLQRGLDLIEKGLSPMKVKQALDEYVKEAILDIQSLVKKVYLSEIDKINSVATIAANNDIVIGSKVSMAFSAVGVNGAVETTSSGKTATEIVYTEGMRLDRGFKEAEMYMPIGASKVTLKNPYILLYNGKVDNFQAHLQIVMQRAIADQRPLLVIVKEVDNQIYKTLSMNKVQGKGEVYVINAPGFGESMTAAFADIASYVKGTVLIPGQAVKVSDLGSAASVILRPMQTVIEDGAGANEFNATNVNDSLISASTYNEDAIAKREKRSATKLAMIMVGAGSEIELKDKLFRYDDAIRAVQCALTDGILPGGGNALKYVDSISDSLFKGCLSCIHNILYSTSKKGFLSLFGTSIKFNEGINLVTGRYEKDLIKAGVVDTVKGIVTALDSAGSVAGTLLLTKVCIYNENVKQF